MVQGMRARYQLPIGCIVHPLADPQDVPVVVPETQGIMRCRRCRTYINPFVSFQEGGRCAAAANGSYTAYKHFDTLLAILFSLLQD